MTKKQPVIIHWFRQDLRLMDNPALRKASQSGFVLPIYIFDDENAGEYAMGEASQWWLYHSLCSLNRTLGDKLNLYRGNASVVLDTLAKRHNVKAIYWNRCYELWRIKRDSHLKERLKQKGIEVESFNGSLLWEPWDIKKQDETNYRVFTPFYRKACSPAFIVRAPFDKPKSLNCVRDPFACRLEDLNLLPKIAWYKQLESYWKISEIAAHNRLDHFLSKSLCYYKEGRNFPAKPYVSGLSPYLHFGQISPHQVWYKTKMEPENENRNHFCAELAWREFSYNLLYHFPELPKKNLQEEFDRFPWQENPNALKDWQRGKTGYPIIDAGMRQLWQTGYMHNRVRMIVASFLVKNLLLDWRQGERWFWDCLVDADLASNSASWQWVAGCGADSAPYFRIFNPVLQGETFDPQGIYTRRFIPELAKLPNRFLFKPWEASHTTLEEAGIVLGKTYPKPIVDLSRSRDKALKAYAQIKK